MERRRAIATAAAITMSVVSGTIALGSGLVATSAQPAPAPSTTSQPTTVPATDTSATVRTAEPREREAEHAPTTAPAPTQTAAPTQGEHHDD